MPMALSNVCYRGNSGNVGDASLGPLVTLDRGRDASYLAPPAQNRTGPIRAYGSHLGCVTAKRFSLRLAVCAPAPVTHLPGSASGACFAGSHSPWPLPFAPPAPRRSRPLCSSASQLLWQSLTSRDRASSATAPRLPDADRRQLPNGRSRDLPVPAQGASAHARFFDHAGSFGPCDGASETCCLPHSKRRRHPGIGFRGSMAGLCPPLPTLRRRPRGRQRTARGRCRSLLLHRSGLAPPTPCRSPGALRVRPPQPRSRVSVNPLRFSVGHPDGANEGSAKHQGRSSSLPPPLTPVLFSLPFYCRRICVLHFEAAPLDVGARSRWRRPYSSAPPTAACSP